MKPIGLLFLPLGFLVPTAPAQTPDLFEGVPWIGYNVGISAYDGNPNATERDPYAIASADFDGDGDADVVVANYDYASPGGTDGSSGFALLFNEGNGTYGEPVHYTVSAKGHFDVEVADFDGDGDADIAMPHSGRIGSEIGNTVVLYLNNGAGAFSPGGAFTVQTRTLDIAVGDFNADGHLDLVAGSAEYDVERVSVLLGDGAGGFAPQLPVTVGLTPEYVAGGDFDGDGYDDLAVSALGDLTVVMNDGAGGFLAPAVLSESGPQEPIVGQISIVDLDADGALDLLHGAYTSGSGGPGFGKEMAVRYGLGDGTFAAPVYLDLAPYATSPEAIIPVDLDGDGDLDVAACDWSGRTGDGLFVALNDGTGTFGELQHIPAGQGTRDIAVADVNGDGAPDLVSADQMSLAVTVHLNDGNGRFPIGRNRFATGTASTLHLTVGDVDDDGDLDALASGESFGVPGAVIKGNGDGTFGAPTVITHSTQYGRGVSRGKLRDLDGDGDLDLLYNDAHTDFHDGYDFYTGLNDGTGTFGPLVQWEQNTCGNGDIDAFDLDNDGDLDVVNLEELGCGGTGDTANKLYINLNNGDATFRPPAIVRISTGPHAIAGGDFNHDGNVDLVTTHWMPYGFRDFLNVHLGNGDGTFQEEAVYPVGRGPRFLVIADFNGDGNEDFATANSSNGNSGRETMTVLFGTGTGSFTGRTDYYAPYAPDLQGVSGIEAGDVDSDGDLDLMVVTVANGIAMYYNDGNGTFSFPHRLGAYWGPWAPTFEDFTGDAVPDLLMLTSTLPAGLGRELTLLEGIGGQAAPVAVSAEPLSPPVSIPADGGPFTFTVTLTNTTAEPQAFEAWSAATGPVNRSPLVGPRAVTLPPGASLSRTITQTVPAAAPAGAYTYTVNVGTFGSAVSASDSFPVTKQGSALATRSVASVAGWRAEGWDSGVSASVEGARNTASEHFALAQNHPNPFDRATTIRYSVPAASHVRLSVYDTLGREVAVLVDSRHSAGEHEAVFEGLALPSGVYLYRLEADRHVKVGRMMLLK